MFNLRLLTLAPVLYCAAIGCELQHPLFYELDLDHPTWTNQDAASEPRGVADTTVEDHRLSLHPPDAGGPGEGDAVVFLDGEVTIHGDVKAIDDTSSRDVLEDEAASRADQPTVHDDAHPEDGVHDVMSSADVLDTAPDTAPDGTPDATADTPSGAAADVSEAADMPTSSCPSSCASDSQCQVPGCGRHTCTLHTCRTSIPTCPVFCSTDSQCAVDVCPFRRCVMGECAM